MTAVFLAAGCASKGSNKSFDVNSVPIGGITESKIPLKVRYQNKIDATFSEYYYDQNTFWTTGGGLEYSLSIDFESLGVRALESIFTNVVTQNSDDLDLLIVGTLKASDLHIHDELGRKSTSPETLEIKFRVFEVKTNNLIDEVSKELFLAQRFKRKYKFFTDRVEAGIPVIYNDLAEKMQGSRATYLAAAKQATTNACSTEKDQLTELFANFKIKKYSSSCEKYTDGLQIAESFNDMYQRCENLDKGTNKRVQFKKVSLSLEQLKDEHCAPRELLVTSDVIKEIQALLNGKGLDAGKVDGAFGEKTRKAIINYQNIVGMPTDGEITQELLDRLKQ